MILLNWGGPIMKKMNKLDWIAVILVIVGALNWGIIGFFGFNLVGILFGTMSILSRIVYGLVGLAGVYMVYCLAKGCKCPTKTEEKTEE